ncbi:endothelial cell-selective adhesion molecule-like [Zalophus californianus]|uniref:Endothelial cell-selective adhesion molecule-like n=1 Tax=Zalophus californianus TaxID=9704 RepID=A0A6J2BXU0_ZALCA|nr:endothelial cell-selective adhesion molecule-like [Zalophus californianus]XP_027434590.1 endothelial cell-selective adhesion molecule-like [Zalophus californianus]XP_027434591.1 endothelial cell-selective adhesion molecule-like [Zalophus californianus]XP_027434592.1 endothelial cell-selective adhesion molecule-like [Zalophus californianus]
MPSQNVSLRLQGLQEKDSGSYRCSVNVQDHQGIKMSHSSKTLELRVLVPPASPSCRLLGVPRVGTNVTLTCQSPRSKPAAQYQWERAPPSAQVFFAPVLVWSHFTFKTHLLKVYDDMPFLCVPEAP